ncbi:MAG: hypothetical protein L0211_07305, partial [Planctomycetaceae bacterium]|nr:hypothetical protein [Planctomycetaceae bacterium]
ATLIGAALIDSDGWRVPRGMFAPTIILSLVVGMFFPAVRPIVAIPDLAVAPWKLGLIEGAAGLAAGMACGALFGLGWLGGSRGQSWPRSAPIMLLAATGAVLGWQRVLVLAPLAALVFAALAIVVRLARAPRIVPLAAVIAALAAWIAVEWAGVLMPVVHRLTGDPLTGGVISALATAAGAILAGALAPATYHSVLPPQGAAARPLPQQGPGSAAAVEPLTGKPLTGEPPAS